jgi:hypothetical protein
VKTVTYTGPSKPKHAGVKRSALLVGDERFEVNVPRDVDDEQAERAKAGAESTGGSVSVTETGSYAQLTKAGLRSKLAELAPDAEQPPQSATHDDLVAAVEEAAKNASEADA